MAKEPVQCSAITKSTHAQCRNIASAGKKFCLSHAQRNEQADGKAKIKKWWGFLRKKLAAVVTILAAVATIWTLVGLVQQHTGDFEIQFYTDLEPTGSSPAIKVELLNNYRKDLNNVSVSAQLRCTNGYNQKLKPTSYCEGYHSIPKGGSQECFYLPDQKFVRVQNSSANECSDAALYVGRYEPVQDSPAISVNTNATLYEIKGADITSSQFPDTHYAFTSLCTECVVYVNVTSDEKNFASNGQYVLKDAGQLFQDFEGSWYSINGDRPFSLGVVSATPHRYPCKDKNESDCKVTVCETVNDKYGLEIDCSLVVGPYCYSSFSTSFLMPPQKTSAYWDGERMYVVNPLPCLEGFMP